MEYGGRGIVCSRGKVNVNGFLLFGKLAHRRPRTVEGAQGFGARAEIVVIAARMDMQLGGRNGMGAGEEEREQGEEFEEAHRGKYSFDRGHDFFSLRGLFGGRRAGRWEQYSRPEHSGHCSAAASFVPGAAAFPRA